VVIQEGRGYLKDDIDDYEGRWTWYVVISGIMV